MSIRIELNCKTPNCVHRAGESNGVGNNYPHIWCQKCCMGKQFITILEVLLKRWGTCLLTCHFPSLCCGRMVSTVQEELLSQPSPPVSAPDSLRKRSGATPRELVPHWFGSQGGPHIWGKYSSLQEWRHAVIWKRINTKIGPWVSHPSGSLQNNYSSQNWRLKHFA